jgi:NADPH:quinone reductase-like Zn-dependent oxidoreductase
VSLADQLAERGEIGGRTVRITESGAVECHEYPLGALPAGMVRVRTALSVISPGTELTYIGRDASNPYLHKTWDPELRVFIPGTPAQDHPIVFGYRAAGTVMASGDSSVPPGTRVYGKWRHTEFTTLPVADARAQRLPDEIPFEDGADLAQMLPIAVNAVAFAEERHAGAPAVVFGCGPVGLILAQVARATGASVVYAVDRLPQRLAIARSLGLETLDAAGEDVALRLKRQHGPDGIPVAFECSGSARALHDAIRSVRRRGTVVAVGFYQGEAAGLFLGDEFHHNGVEVRSGQIGNLHPRWQIGPLRAFGMELVRRRAVVLGGLPRSVFRVEQAADAFEALKRPEAVLQAALSYERGI